MNYADKLGVPFVVFVGEDEIKEQVVSCKDMRSGEQTKLSFEQTLQRVGAALTEQHRSSIIKE